MPTPSRWLIKTALGYLVLALGLAAARAVQEIGVLPGDAATLWLPQLHLLTVGWLTQLIFGVAFWLFPRPRPDPWGDTVVWAAYALLNLGLGLRLLSEPAWLPGPFQRWGLLVSAALQWGSSLLLAGYFWRRVRST